MKSSNFSFVFLVGKRVSIEVRERPQNIKGKVKQAFQDFVVIECEKSNLIVRQDDVISIEIFNEDK